MDVIDITKWDHNPQRGILVALLFGAGPVQGEASVEEYLHEMQRGGVILFRVATPEEARESARTGARKDDRFWWARLTDTGYEVGLGLAHSCELVRMLEVWFQRGLGPRGVPPTRILRELDLRLGADGSYGGDAMDWLTKQTLQQLLELPRRGDLGRNRRG